MPDNPNKKRADGKRVALSQDHERRYLLEELGNARLHLLDIQHKADRAERQVGRALDRLVAGFPATTKGKRRGK